MRPGIYIGAAVSALLLLLPYVNLIFLPAYVLGSLVGVWCELKVRQQPLNFTRGGQLGFYSAFYGTISAIALSQIATHFLHEKLWRLENLYQLPPLLASKGLNTDTATGWYFWMVEIVIIAILAGAVGVPSGMLGVRLFQRSSQSL
jgi:hypothetical protein